jgi:hypothetical protein
MWLDKFCANNGNSFDLGRRVRNPFLTNPNMSLTEGRRYGIKPWIEALLDNEAVLPSDHRKRSITPPPPFFRPAESDAGSVTSSAAPPSAGTRRRSTRSMSPGKRIMTPRKSRASKATVKDSPLKKEVTPIPEKEEAQTITTTESTTLAASTTPANGASDARSVTTPVKKNPQFKVEVEEEVQTSPDIEKKTTHVKVELPVGEPLSTESTEEMLSKAREMVAEARKLERESTPAAKRKVDELEDEEDEEDEAKDEDESRNGKPSAPRSSRISSGRRRSRTGRCLGCRLHWP